jgi:hypothetical protein
MKFTSLLNKEIVHYAGNNVLITSKYRTVSFQKNGETRLVKLPEPSLIKNFLGLFRLSRRALRLDKCNVFLHDDNLIIIRAGIVYHYDSARDILQPTLKLRNCRNILHQSINATPEGLIYFGEYGSNKNRESVPVYRSDDGGRSWVEIYTFSPGDIKHIHGCYYDKYTDTVWVCTGDFQDENWLLQADRDFKEVKRYGDGQQRFRTCNLIFTEQEVHWLMDSQLEASYHIKMDRSTQKVTVGQKLMGPVWYIKSLGEGLHIAATAQEIGDGVLDNKIHLYASEDLHTWKTVKTFDHDGLPKGYFKFGVIGFADGPQTRDNFYMFFEATKGLDGKSVKCSI